MSGKFKRYGSVERSVVVTLLSMLLVFASAWMTPVPVSAQSKTDDYVSVEDFESRYDSTFGTTTENTGLAQHVMEIRKALIRFLKIVLFIVSLGSLVLAVYNMMSGENSGAKRFFMWGIALAVGLILLEVLGKVGGSAAGAVSEGFAGLQGTVAEVLEIALSIIMMVTLVVVAIHIMNGERDGFQKFFRWIIISNVGLVVIEAIRLKT